MRESTRASAAQRAGAAFKQFESTQFSRIATEYDKLTRVTSQTDDALLDAVKAGPGRSLLDVACGPGRLIEAGLARGAAITGIDFADTMITLAGKRNPTATVVVGDAEDLPFGNDSFDAIVCNFGILHFPNPDVALTQMHRVLKPGGRIAFTCWLAPDRNPFMRLVLGAVQQHGDMNVELPDAPPLFRFSDPEECKKALDKAGLVYQQSDVLPLKWDFPSAPAFVETIMSSSARLSALINLQSEEQASRIKAAIAQGAEEYMTGQGIEVPASALLTVARKAGVA